jgi:hypothetical protein
VQACNTHERKRNNIYRVLVANPEGKRQLGRPRRRWENNIKVDLRGTDGLEWTKFIWLRMGGRGGVEIVSSCEQGNEHPGSTKC